MTTRHLQHGSVLTLSKYQLSFSLRACCFRISRVYEHVCVLVVRLLILLKGLFLTVDIDILPKEALQN